LTFEELLGQNLFEHSQICIEVGEKASREKSIKNSLNLM